MAAAHIGHEQSVKTLLGAGAGVNITTNTGVTVVMNATYTGHRQCVSMLLDAGADVNIASEEGGTVINKACSLILLPSQTCSHHKRF